MTTDTETGTGVSVDPHKVVVLVSKETFDGYSMVRWFRDLWSAERNHHVLSVSAHGITVGSNLIEIPSQWLDKAKEVHSLLLEDPRADVSHFATHRNSGPSNGPLVPVSDNG